MCAWKGGSGRRFPKATWYHRRVHLPLNKFRCDRLHVKNCEVKRGFPGMDTREGRVRGVMRLATRSDANAGVTAVQLPFLSLHGPQK